MNIELRPGHKGFGGLLAPRVARRTSMPPPPSPPAAATLFPSFADPGSSGIWADLTVSQRTQRQLVAGEMVANGWLVDPDTVTFDDTVTITSSAQLDTWFNGTAVGGVTRNVTRNQRVLLDPAGTWTYASEALIDRARGLDYLSWGKMLLVDGQGIDMRSRVQITGTRGLFWRNTRFSCSLLDTGADLTWSPGAVTVNVTNGGSGFEVGQALTVVTRGAFVYTDPVLTVASIGAGGAITAVTVNNRGMMTGTSAITVSSATSTGNATLSCVPGTNVRDTNIIFVNRSSSFPLLSVVNFADCAIGSGLQTDNALAWMVGITADNIDQLGMLRCSFDGFQTGLRAPTVRRLIVHECDGQRQIGDWSITLNTRVNTTGVGATYASIYPDGQVFHWFSRNTLRRPYSNADLVNSAGHDMGIDQEHSDPQQWGTSGDTGGYQAWNELNAYYLGRTIAKFRAAKGLTYYGGTQGPYTDDSSYRIDRGVFGDFYGTVAANSIVAFNGVTEVGRTTAVRVGALGPSGSNVNDSTPNAVARSLTASGFSSTLNLVKCVVGGTSTPTGSTIIPGTINQAGTVNADPTVAGDYAAKFPGAFTTDGEGRTVYTFDDGGTRAAFRAALWAQFGRAGEGFFNPASWG